MENIEKENLFENNIENSQSLQLFNFDVNSLNQSALNSNRNIEFDSVFDFKDIENDNGNDNPVLDESIFKDLNFSPTCKFPKDKNENSLEISQMVSILFVY